MGAYKKQRIIIQILVFETKFATFTKVRYIIFVTFDMLLLLFFRGPKLHFISSIFHFQSQDLLYQKRFSQQTISINYFILISV